MFIHFFSQARLFTVILGKRALSCYLKLSITLFEQYCKITALG